MTGGAPARSPGTNGPTVPPPADAPAGIDVAVLDRVSTVASAAIPNTTAATAAAAPAGWRPSPPRRRRRSSMETTTGRAPAVAVRSALDAAVPAAPIAA